MSLSSSTGKNPTYDVNFFYQGSGIKKSCRFNEFRELNNDISNLTNGTRFHLSNKFPPDLWSSKFGGASVKQLNERSDLLDKVTILFIIIHTGNSSRISSRILNMKLFM